MQPKRRRGENHHGSKPRHWIGYAEQKGTSRGYWPAGRPYYLPRLAGHGQLATDPFQYVGELLFNMLVLVGSVKMSDRIIREMMGL